MHYAIIQTGGKQYRVSPGDRVTVEKLDGEPGASVELDHVLAVSKDGHLTIGSPTVAGAKVLAEVTKQGRGEKLTVFKFKRKVRYRVKTGHRQSLTELTVKEIVDGGAAGEQKAPRRRRTTRGT